MSCLKGESEVKKKAASYACDKCGAAAKKKSHLCKPVKLAEADKGEKKGKKGKKKKD